MNIIKKLQNQPEYVRKAILWSTVIVLGLVLLIWQFFSLSKKIKNFEGEEFIEQLNLPVLEKEFQEFPKIEIPEVATKELERLREEMEKAGEEMNEGGEGKKFDNMK